MSDDHSNVSEQEKTDLKAKRIVFGSEVAQDFRRGTMIYPAGKLVRAPSQEDKGWATEVGEAQIAKQKKRPAHFSAEIEEALVVIEKDL